MPCVIHEAAFLLQYVVTIAFAGVNGLQGSDFALEAQDCVGKKKQGRTCSRLQGSNGSRSLVESNASFEVIARLIQTLEARCGLPANPS